MTRLILGASFNLQTLALDKSWSGEAANRKACSGFLKRLSSPLVVFPRLQNLILGWSYCSEAILSGLILRFKENLQKLKLEGIRILGGKKNV